MRKLVKPATLAKALGIGHELVLKALASGQIASSGRIDSGAWIVTHSDVDRTFALEPGTAAECLSTGGELPLMTAARVERLLGVKAAHLPILRQYAIIPAFEVGDRVWLYPTGPIKALNRRA